MKRVRHVQQALPGPVLRAAWFGASRGLSYAGVVIRSVLPSYGAAGAPICKYHPSCSQYAADALRRYGPVRGSLKAGWRLLRCNPWSRGGVDPA